MTAINPLIQFEFSLEPGVSDTELETLWRSTQKAQLAMDRFLAGELSEFEMTDYLDFYDINTGETLETMESNAQFMGLYLP